MTHFKHKTTLIIPKGRKTQADAIFQKHLGGPVAWQELHGRSALASSSVTHYLLEIDADDAMWAVVKLVDKTIASARLTNFMGGRRNRAQLRTKKDAIVTGANLKKKPRRKV